MSKVKNIQLVEFNDLELDADTFDTVIDFYEGARYDRYYPDKRWDFLDPDVKSKVNKSLIDAGAVFNDDEFFYILLRF